MSLDRNGRVYGVLSSVRRNFIRVAKRLRAVDPTAYVHRRANVSRDLRAEEWVFIAAGVTLGPLVRIGRYSMLAANVAIVGDDHEWDVVGVPSQFTGRPRQQVTSIGRDVWVGRGALICRGVTIGDGAVVGAHAVVTHDVEPYTVVVGVPARPLRVRFPEPEDRAAHSRMLYGSVVPRRVAPPLGRVAGPLEEWAVPSEQVAVPLEQSGPG